MAAEGTNLGQLIYTLTLDNEGFADQVAAADDQMAALADTGHGAAGSLDTLGASADEMAANIDVITDSADGAVGGITVLGDAADGSRDAFIGAGESAADAAGSLQLASDAADETSASLDRTAVSAGEAAGATEESGAAAADASGGFDLFGGSMLKSLAPLAGLFVGFEGLKAVFEDSKLQLNQWDDANAQIVNSLKNTHDAIGMNITQIDNMADATAKGTDFTKSMNLTVEASLVTLQGMNKEAMPQAVTLTDDLATKMALLKGQAVPSLQQTSMAAKAMAKAMADPTTATAAFTRAGVTLSSTQVAVIKAIAANTNATDAQALSIKGVTDAGAKALSNWSNLTSAQQTAAETADGLTASQITAAKAMGTANAQTNAQKQLLTDLTGYVGGAASAATTTFSGKVTELKNAMAEELVPAMKAAEADLEKLGAALFDIAGKVIDFLKPAFDGLFQAIKEALPTVERLTVDMKPLAEVIGAALVVALGLFIDALRVTIEVISSVLGYFEKHKTAVEVLAGVITAVAVPAMIAWGISAVSAAVTSASAFASMTAEAIGNFISIAAGGDASSAVVVAGWSGSAIASAAAWVIAGATMVAGWIATAASAVASVAVTVATSVAGAVATAAAWVAGAVATAAAWLIANAAVIAGVLLIVAVVAAVVYEIIDHWNDIKQWFSDFYRFLVGIWQDIEGFLKDAGIVILAILLLPLVPFVLAWREFGSTIIQGIQAIVSGIESVWNTVVSVFTTVINAVEAVIMGVVNVVIDIFKDAWNGVVAVWNMAAGFFMTVVNLIKAPFEAVVGFVASIFSAAWNTLVSIWGNVTGFVKTYIIDPITNGVKDFGTLLEDAGKALIDGLVNGIKGAVGDVTDAVKSVGSDAVSAAKDVLKIFSPSQVFSDIGTNVSLGMAQGITNGSQQATQAATQMATSVVGAGAAVPGVISSPGASNGGTVNYNIDTVELSSADAVDEFFNVQNRNTQLAGLGTAPLAGTTGN